MLLLLLNCAFIFWCYVATSAGTNSTDIATLQHCNQNCTKPGMKQTPRATLKILTYDSPRNSYIFFAVRRPIYRYIDMTVRCCNPLAYVWNALQIQRQWRPLHCDGWTKHITKKHAQLSTQKRNDIDMVVVFRGLGSRPSADATKTSRNKPLQTATVATRTSTLPMLCSASRYTQLLIRRPTHTIYWPYCSARTHCVPHSKCTPTEQHLFWTKRQAGRPAGQVKSRDATALLPGCWDSCTARCEGALIERPEQGAGWRRVRGSETASEGLGAPGDPGTLRLSHREISLWETAETWELSIVVS
jgi:hypothetical protein